MRRFCVLLVLAAITCIVFPGCGSEATPPKKLTSDQEKQLEEKLKEVHAAEQKHQQEEQSKAAPPRPVAPARGQQF